MAKYSTPPCSVQAEDRNPPTGSAPWEGQGRALCKESAFISNSVDNAETTNQIANVTEPLPLSPQPGQISLRSITISGIARESNLSGVVADDDGDSTGTPMSAPTAFDCTCPRAGAPPSSHESSKLLSSKNSIGAVFAGSASASTCLNSGQVSELALLKAAHPLDRLTTAYLTCDVSAAAGASEALMWTEGQGGPVQSQVTVGCSWGGQLGTQQRHAAARSQTLPQRQLDSAVAPTSPRRHSDGGQMCTAAHTTRAPAQTPTPPLSSLPWTVMNLAQVRDVVQELRVLHIRPGAALLVGNYTAASSQRVVARFERGCPSSLLSPQLLSALRDGRWRAHEHVVSMLGVHAVMLPAHVLLEAPAAAAPPPMLRNSLKRSDGGGAAGCTAGAGFWELLDADLATATRAIQQAEAVRGASNGGSGLIGSALPSSSTATVASGRLMRALKGPQIRLRDVVGHLRTGAGAGARAPAVRGSPARPMEVLEAASGSCPLARRGDIAFVTLSIMELCEGGNLFDESRRGSFRCCIPENAAAAGPGRRPPRKGGGAAGALQDNLRCFSDGQFLRRLDRFLSTARQVAHGLRFLHSVCRIPHGDLVSRNVLLKRCSPNDPGVSCSAGGGGDVGNFVAKLTGYGRLETAASPAQPGDEAANNIPSIKTGAGEVAWGCPAAAATAAAVVLGNSPHEGHLHVSTTSISRVNAVHVGLWRDVHSLAPERLRDPQAPATFEADVYAYGSILYEMAVGESPWASLLPTCVAVGIATGDLQLRWPAGAAPLTSIAALVERCVAPAPEDRPSLGQLLAELDAIEAEADAGRELAEALRQQRRSERLMQTFLEESSSASASSSSTLSGFCSHDGVRSCGGASRGDGLLEVCSR